MGVPSWAPEGLAFVARDLGYFDDDDIELVQYDSPIELARHFREGNLDAAALTLDFVPYWAASIPMLDVVFVIGVSQGADGLVANPEITDFAGLRGKRVGVEASPLGAHNLLRALKAGGLTIRNIEPVLVDSEDQAEAFAAHRLDAVVTREPDRARLVSGGATSLFDSTQAPGQVVDVLVVSRSKAAERADSLRKLIDAWLAAMARLKSDHAATAERLASAVSLDVRSLDSALSGWRLADLALNREMLGGAPPRLAATLAEIESLAAGAGLLRADRRPSVHFDDSLLPNIVAGGGAR